MFELSRPEPKLPEHAMTTFRIVQPHDRLIVAACQAVGCEKWRNGWDNVLDMTKPAHVKAAELFRSGRTGRTFRELAAHGTNIVVFRFESGQRCFDEHRTRPNQFIKRGGDWRGNPRQELLVHRTAADWQEDFAEHQDRLAEGAKRG